MHFISRALFFVMCCVLCTNDKKMYTVCACVSAIETAKLRRCATQTIGLRDTGSSVYR